MMNENKRQQLDEWLPALIGAGRLVGGWLLKKAPGAVSKAKSAGRWAVGGSKSARVARGVANVAGIASMMGGGGGGAGGNGGGYGGGHFDPGAYRDAEAGRSKKQASLLDPRTVGYDPDGEDGDDGNPGPGEARPDQMGAYGRANREKKFMKTQSESWIRKIASVAKGAGRKAAGAATGKYGRGVQAATIGGAAGVAGRVATSRARGRKQDSKAMYGGGANPNPYAKRSLGARLGFSTATESVDEGLVGSALKGAAVGAAGYGVYKGIKALRNPENRAKIGRAVRGTVDTVKKHLANPENREKIGRAARGTVDTVKKHLADVKASGSPVRKKVVNTSGKDTA